MILQLLCTVRTCGQPLQREERRVVCGRGHSFDVARSGYVNLLQPQDRRSRQPGDTREAVSARRRFLDAGFGEPLVRAMLDFARNADSSGAPLSPAVHAGEDTGAPVETVLDVGCGEGYHLNAFQGERHGVDISVPAIDAAARRYPLCHWVVANADRFLPYADDTFDLITSITARINAPQFARTLRRGGHVLVALPAPDDLIELREAVLGEGKLIDRTSRVIDEMRDHFTLAKQTRAARVARLDAGAIRDVMSSSYRGLRASQREKLERLSDTDVTLSRDLLLFTSRKN